MVDFFLRRADESEDEDDDVDVLGEDVVEDKEGMIGDTGNTPSCAFRVGWLRTKAGIGGTGGGGEARVGLAGGDR
ncbi:hypothetical protein VNI00_001283 [Paramarasmius palmivorus]|uniref:Uncharacterized protein n=1 Tax=Paramarasmius palmivorus TaxID=297713 RepID=A0AAW0E5F1_9AGAR